MGAVNREGEGNLAVPYVRDNFAPSDRLAVVLINKRAGSVIQRLSSAETVGTSEFQEWLLRQNARRYDVYLSMNALAPTAVGRTKSDIAAIRHLYLDFDTEGTSAVDALLKRDDLPRPNYLISTSPDKWQVVWKVEGFGKAQAEALQRALVRETGADPAATDCARVLRLPGFFNHKYSQPYWVRPQTLAMETYGPERFPVMPSEERIDGLSLGHRPARLPVREPGALSQSERDWAYAKRALARGESPALVVAAIAGYRRDEKYNPRDYAERTVKKAGEALKAEAVRDGIAEPERL
jgi:hypothetical protein